MEVDEPAPRPVKKQKPPPKNLPSTARTQANGNSQAPAVESANPVSEPQIDERFLSARELKKKRKDEAKNKRDERKSRKEATQIETLEEAGAGMMVGMKGDEEEVGMKRKAGDGDDSQRRKKAKE
jgi:DNA-directed RNA polymerase I subunit RPA43